MTLTVLQNERLGHPHLNPNLVNIAVTRSFGDFMFKMAEHTDGKPSGLIAEPDIISVPLTTDDYFLLLASDGEFSQNLQFVHSFSLEIREKKNLFFFVFAKSFKKEN